jgi:hypothetical protein
VLIPASSLPLLAQTSLISTVRCEINISLCFRDDQQKIYHLVLCLAVTAATVEFAKVRDIERVDDNLFITSDNCKHLRDRHTHSSTTVVLDDLVGRTLGTTIVDARRATLLLDGHGVLAHFLKVDVVEGAGTEAVNALGLVGANDDVLESGTLLEEEDGVVVTALRLASACTRAAVEASVGGSRLVGLTCGNRNRLAKRRSLGGRREALCVANKQIRLQQ